MKEYNPFAMFGSYLGGLLLYVISIFYTPGCAISQTPIPIVFGGKWCVFYINGFLGLTYEFWIVVIGFLIGWLIHSLVKLITSEVKNKNDR